MKESKLIYKNKYPDSEIIFLYQEYIPSSMSRFGYFAGILMEIKRAPDEE